MVEQAATSVIDASLGQKVARGVSTFLFAPASARPPAALRVSLSLVLLGQAWLLRTEVMELFAHDGIVQGDLSRYLGGSGAPRASWLVDSLAPWGVSESACLYALCGLYVASLVGLGLGLFTRCAAVMAWFLHWTLIRSAGTTSYGADTYAHIFLFYLMLVPAGDAWSLDALRKRAGRLPSSAARLGLRVMQLHLCVSYLASGIQKSQGIQWWNGEVLWRALSLPVYQQLDLSWLASYPWICQIAAWTALFAELGYCVFIWPARTRRLWIAAIVVLHLGIAVFLGLGVFGALMCVLTVTLFGVSPEPAAGGPSPGLERVALWWRRRRAASA
jgi:hypothetical protein